MADMEVIIVDDGSTDSSPAICDEYAIRDSRVRVFHTDNRGVSSARNTGFDVAQGEWICFMDNDDYLLETRLDEMLEKEESDLEVIAGGYSELAQGKIQQRHPSVRAAVYSGEQLNSEILRRLVFKGQFSPVWASMFKRSFIELHGLMFRSPKEIYPEDTQFSIEAFADAGKVLVADSCGYCYRVHNQSVSHSYQANLFVRMVKQLEYECSILSNNFGEDFSDVRQKKAPGYVAIALFKESLCDKKTAKANIRAILDSSFAKEAFSGKCDFMYGGNRYWPFYILGKLGCVNGIYCLSKLYKKGEGIYRLLK
jgi:Glycosyltransferases, probably involved in cell wall biogenesis